MRLLPEGDSALCQRTLNDLATEESNAWKGFTPLPLYPKTIEEAAGKAIEDFYQTFKEPTDLSLETPYAVWPPH